MSKAQLMEELAERIRVCVECPLSEKRLKAVPGDGDVESLVVFVGEAPGYWEDVWGLPFVGAAGKVLDSLLEEIGLRRDSVFITNVVKCRPPENREPRPFEISTCTRLYLDRQIRLIKPKVVATLGRHSTNYILSKAGVENVVGIGGLRGEGYSVKLMDLPIEVVPTYHPASVLHNPKYRDALKSDFELLRLELKKRKIM